MICSREGNECREINMQKIQSCTYLLYSSQSATICISQSVKKHLHMEALHETYNKHTLIRQMIEKISYSSFTESICSHGLSCRTVVQLYWQDRLTRCFIKFTFDFAQQHLNGCTCNLFNWLANCSQLRDGGGDYMGTIITD